MVNIDEMLKQALYDGVVECPYCSTSMEPDSNVCPQCNKKNPLRKMGYI